MAKVLTEEETTSAKINRIKELAFLWHQDKFLSWYSINLHDEDQERIIEGVLDISKEIMFKVFKKGRDRKKLKKDDFHVKLMVQHGHSASYENKN